ncbi:MAG: glutathione S-transferase family protein [Gammaproteobacteria bacterium]|nr:MAG: glutathione S-transferase family protein [Gammaproteobacteria bacterium]
MITIHGSPISPFVRKTLVCLIEKGVDYELNPVTPFPAPESHLKISPLGKIPAMTDGELAIPDSSAICGYLEKRYPDHPVYPTDPADYGRALWYEDWADNELPKATAALFFNRVAVKMMKQEPDEAVIQRIITDVQPPIFDYLESEIEDRTYLLGDDFSIADIAITCQFIQMMYSGEALPAESHPSITRYVTHHMHRDSFKGLINSDPFMKLD